MTLANYNLGVDVLKIVSCVGVVMMHFGLSSYFVHCAVPVFMMTAVYLSWKMIDGGGVINRLKRLAIPYFSWGVIYFIVKSALHGAVDAKMLFYQFAFGAPACPVMYFILLLASSTVTLHLMCRFRYSSWIIGAFFVGFLIVQYTGLNFVVAKQFGRYGAICVGRFFELFPSAVVGYTFYKKSEWLYRNKVASIIICAVIGMGGFLPNCGGYGYQGMGMLCLSTVIFLSFCLVGMAVKRDAYTSLVRFLASLTAGIYYMHLLVGWTLERIIGAIEGAFMVPLVLSATACCVWAMMKLKYMRVLVK